MDHIFTWELDRVDPVHLFEKPGLFYPQNTRSTKITTFNFKNVSNNQLSSITNHSAARCFGQNTPYLINDKLFAASKKKWNP